MNYKYRDTEPIFFFKRDGTELDPYLDIIENITVEDNRIFLKESPDKYQKVKVENGSILYSEVDNIDKVTSATSYFVDYREGVVYFHGNANNKAMKISYKGIGVLLYPASRIYLSNNTGQGVEQTLQDLVNKSKEELDGIEEALSGVQGAIDSANQSAQYAKQQGDYAKTEASNLGTIKTDAIKATQDANTATSNANQKITEIQNKITEFDSNEATRIANENARKTAESTRDINESNRILAEDTRKLNESTRESSESLRNTKETERQSNETTRIADENTRKQEENVRKANEDIRIANETQRQEDASQVIDKVSKSIDGLHGKGEYDSSVQYAKNNVVSFNGDGYICISDAIGIEPTVETHWKIVVHKGEKGDKGDQGLSIKGDKGDKGDTGEGFKVTKTYASIEEMNSDFSNPEVPLNSFVLINTGNVEEEDNAKLYIKRETEFSFLIDLSGAKGIKGEKGDKGDKPSHQWDGTILRFENPDGTLGEPVDLKGEKGDRGLDGKGSIITVNGILPELDGNVILIPENIGASPSGHTHAELHTHINKDVLDKLTDEQGILKYNGQAIGSVTSVNGEIGDVIISVTSIGAETPEGAQAKIDIHSNRKDNPHNVTKSQIGLGNVDDTSDINKPISTATQTALDDKISKSEKGVAGGLATLNADGKVVDMNGNLVEGKVKSVNGVSPDSSGNIEIDVYSTNDIDVKITQLTNDDKLISDSLVSHESYNIGAHGGDTGLDLTQTIEDENLPINRVVKRSDLLGNRTIVSTLTESVIGSGIFDTLNIVTKTILGVDNIKIDSMNYTLTYKDGKVIKVTPQ